MKVVAINGSARKNGNTAIAIKRVFSVLEKHGIETELIQLSGKSISGCSSCLACYKSKNKKCVNNKDIVNECIEKMSSADGIILGSPVYFTDVSASMKAFIERSGYVAKANDYMFKHKVGVAITAVRRGGATHAFDTINHFFQWNQMFLTGSTYWNMMYGREIGEVENDSEGIVNMDNLGENMAILLEKLQN
ncbi:NADPH-dependent FMN reductase [Clostridium sp. DL-VIII]|uniref:flavodoxin family protein n=1 Tax=Clostridium sp. DL-VIII TaxID=641107 RepID=UPI00023B08D5|nr:flavodoxin family protein [Clostridium sp. DL-VIII]EHJ02255.1 NADPH-dependent FMN reductase [Clostridium sp. DL-VIII]